MLAYWQIIAVNLKEQVLLILTAMVCLVSVTRTVTREPTVILLLSSSSKTRIKGMEITCYTSVKHFFPLHIIFCQKMEFVCLYLDITETISKYY